jgi:hypothetical protein
MHRIKAEYRQPKFHSCHHNVSQRALSAHADRQSDAAVAWFLQFSTIFEVQWDVPKRWIHV